MKKISSHWSLVEAVRRLFAMFTSCRTTDFKSQRHQNIPKRRMLYHEPLEERHLLAVDSGMAPIVDITYLEPENNAVASSASANVASYDASQASNDHSVDETALVDAQLFEDTLETANAESPRIYGPMPFDAFEAWQAQQSLQSHQQSFQQQNQQSLTTDSILCGGIAAPARDAFFATPRVHGTITPLVFDDFIPDGFNPDDLNPDDATTGGNMMLSSMSGGDPPNPSGGEPGTSGGNIVITASMIGDTSGKEADGKTFQIKADLQQQWQRSINYVRFEFSGDAVYGSDYCIDGITETFPFISGTLNSVKIFHASATWHSGGTGEASFTVKILNDAIPEIDERIVIKLLEEQHYSGGTDTFTGEEATFQFTIKDDDWWKVGSTIYDDASDRDYSQALEPCTWISGADRHGRIRIYREAVANKNATDRTYDVDVDFSMSGTAIVGNNGTSGDYHLTKNPNGGVPSDIISVSNNKGKITIPRGADFIDLYVMPNGDYLFEADETAILTVTKSYASGVNPNVAANLFVVGETGSTVTILQAPEFISNRDSDPLPATIPVNADYYNLYISTEAEAGTSPSGKMPIHAVKNRPVKFCLDGNGGVFTVEENPGSDKLFRLDVNTGVVTLLRKMTEAEKNQTYTTRIKVYDSTKDERLYDLADVTVNPIKLDLDIDSDNNGLDRSELEENVEESSPGKIIYYNDDDDDNNNVSDRLQSSGTGGDNELVSATLEVQSQTGSKLKLTYDSNLIAVWLDPTKNSNKWSSGSTKIMNVDSLEQTLYIEAIGFFPTGPNESLITCSMVMPDGAEVAIDRIKVTNAIFAMNHTETNFNPVYKDYTQDTKDKMWTCDLNNNVYTTPDNHGSEAGPPLVSALEYEDGFEMTFDYEFVRRGYIQGQAETLLNTDGTYKRKLSFVGNSGVKLGSESGYEVAIFDTKAMVDRITTVNAQGETVTGLDAFKYSCLKNQNGVVIKESGIQPGAVGMVKIDDYAVEPLSKLMNGVGYGQGYMIKDTNGTLVGGMYDYVNTTGNDGTWEKYYNTLVNNYNNCNISNHMKIVWTPKEPSSTIGKLEVYRNGLFSFEYPNVAIGDGKIYLQSHWGSGVTFSDVSITNLRDVPTT